jgi:MFS transporter, DHA3 family, macrolide efflux protein
MTASTPALGARDVLRIPDFRRLWIAQGISDIGDGLTLLTVMLLVNQLTGSTLALAAVSIALAIPPLTIGLIAGTYADRFDRRRIMIVSDLLRAVVVLGFVFVGSADLVPLIIALAFVQASIGTFFNPARGALVPRVVPTEGLLAANSIGQATRVIGGVIGAAMAGLIVGVAGVTWPAFVIDAITFLASAAIVLRVAAEAGRPSAAEAVASSGTRGAVAEGLRIVAGSRVLWTTLLALAISMLGLGAVNVLFLPLIVDVLDVSPVWLGAVDIAQSASMIMAAGIVAVLAARLRPTTIISVGIVAAGILVGLCGAVTEVWQVLLLLFAIGWFITPLQASIVTIMQTGVPDAARGRVMSTLQASMSGASIASMALAGIFGDIIGIREVFFASAVIVVVGGIISGLLYRGTSVAAPGGSVVEAADSARPGATPGLEEALGS